MTYTIRPITADEVPDFLRADSLAFFDTLDDADIKRESPLVDLDRTLAVLDGDHIVATSGVYPFQLTVPGGGRLAAAGLAFVAVNPTYRRQGLLRRMIEGHLRHTRQLGEPFSILYASESTIYGRFGYGPATHHARYRVERAHAALAPRVEGEGRLILPPIDEAFALMPGIYARAVAGNPGALSREDRWWRHFQEHTTTSVPSGGYRFCVIAHDASGEPAGYATYRVKRDWQDGTPANELTVGDLYALTPEAAASLWGFLLGMDLVSTIVTLDRPLEDPLRWLLADSRRLQTTSTGDGLWLRLLDIPAALEGRRYQAPGHLILEVTDDLLPDLAGRYHLEGGPDGARCDRTNAEPDLRLGISDLGAIYLGGTRPSTLAQAGRLRELHPGALRLAEAMFAAEAVPFCTVSF
ncbi:MAG TPA: GNAT family N-acetyltransferase [Chloroflexota bacterium]|nr:GNAT family N-acetyltransferase [Chloroflexota bacterium]